MPNILAGLGLAAGRNILIGQQMDAAQADIDYKQGLVKMQQMQQQQAQHQMEVQKAEADYFRTQAAADSAEVEDPLRAAKAYEKTASFALQQGDFSHAKLMSDLAKGKVAEARDRETLKLKEQQDAKESLTTAATDYGSAPTPENRDTLIKRAIKAGVPPSSIPLTDQTKFNTWAQQQQMASMTGKERLAFLEKQREFQQSAAEKKREFDERLQDRQIARQQNALLRESIAASKGDRAPTIKEFDNQPYQWDPSGQIKGDRDRPDSRWVKVGGPKQGMQQQGVTAAITGSAAEAVRGLRVISAMPPTATAGAFQGLHSGTILQSLARVGTNGVTPQSQQLYQTASAGLGLELGRVLTLGGGRGVNQSQIDEFQKMTQVAPNDTEFTAMFKFANAADIVRNRMSTLPDHPDPKVKAQQAEVMKDLEKIPTPEQVLAEAQKAGQGKQVLRMFKTLGEAAEKIKNPPKTSGTQLEQSDLDLISKYKK